MKFRSTSGMSIVSIMLNFVSVKFTAGLKRTLFPVHFYDYVFVVKMKRNIIFLYKCRYCRSVPFYWVPQTLSQRMEEKLFIFFVSFVKNCTNGVPFVLLVLIDFHTEKVVLKLGIAKTIHFCSFRFPLYILLVGFFTKAICVY